MAAPISLPPPYRLSRTAIRFLCRSLPQDFIYQTLPSGHALSYPSYSSARKSLTPANFQMLTIITLRFSRISVEWSAFWGLTCVRALTPKNAGLHHGNSQRASFTKVKDTNKIDKVYIYN